MAPSFDARPRRDALSAALIAGAPLVWIVGYRAAGALSWTPAAWISAALCLAAGLVGARARLGAVLGVLAVATLVAGASPRLIESPMLALTAICVAALVSWVLLVRPEPVGVDTPWPTSDPAVSRVRGACTAAVLAAGVATRFAGETPVQIAAGLSLIVAVVTILAWLFGDVSRRTRFALGALSLTALAVAARQPTWAVPILALPPIGALFIARQPVSTLPPWLQALGDHPAALVVTTFAGLSVIGAIVLWLPVSSVGDAPRFIDALFTAVSAVCVTGLVVLDTGKDFSAFGQAAIIVLIQVGGLGIMSFYTVALRFMGRRLSIRHERTIAGTIGSGAGSHVFGALSRVLVVTAIVEAAGAVVLTALFWVTGDPPGAAIWRGVFTAISAFCNAGFALDGDSLLSYQTEPALLHVVAILIVLGGLSPLAITLLPRLIRRELVPLQVKLICATTAVMLALGTVLFLAFEWSHSLDRLSFWNRVHNAWFQSVTLRTAGFNSVDLAETNSATRALMMTFMFVGGSPGSTAGGIKTTTFALLVLAVVAALRGRAHVTVFGRSIRHGSVYKAAAVATMGAASVFAGIATLHLTQHVPFDVGAFEVFSALGTVGLSLGGTLLLDDVGKWIIALCMFMGRIGPLTLILSLVDRNASTPWKYPAEEVDVG